MRGRPYDPALRSLPVRFSNRRHILPRISNIASNNDLSLFEMIRSYCPTLSSLDYFVGLDFTIHVG